MNTSPDNIARELILKAAADGLFTLFARSTVKGPKYSDSEDEEEKNTAMESGITRVIASTSTPDRYGDVVIQEGWELESFKANPVIMPFHNYNSAPVGRGENIGLVEHASGKALAMDIRWDTGWDLGARLARQYAEGFMQGVSVGFRPLEYSSRSELEEGHPMKSEVGFLIKKSELLELSAAPVPVQQEALAIKNLGLGVAPTPEDADAGILRAIRKALRSDPETQREIRRIFKGVQLAQPEKNQFQDIADWLTS